MTVKNAASALGETIGKLIEDELQRIIAPLCRERGYVYDRGGERPGKRKGVKLAMVNKSGNIYQLDGVIEAPGGEPIILLESKYLRYKKHNRDKASWTCAAHYSLRKSHPTVRKSIAIISGNWSSPSKQFMQSFGIELYEIPFPFMCDVLIRKGIEFDWDEKDSQTPRASWEKFQELPDPDKQAIGENLVRPIRDNLTESIRLALDMGEDWVKRLSELEILLKTERNEYFTYSFPSAKDAMQFLLNLQIDAPDLRGKL